MIVKTRGSRQIETDTGELVAYATKHPAFGREQWFVALCLPENVDRAARNAICGLDGFPPADGLARKINELLGAQED